MVGLSAATPVLGQGFGEAIISGIARDSANTAEEFLEKAPERFSEIVGQKEKAFGTEQACLSDLQLFVNSAVLISQVMPFSNVWIEELDGSSVATFRLMLNGEKAHARISCQENLMISKLLDWDDPTPEANPYKPGTFAASLGVLLSMSQRGEFEGEAENASNSTSIGSDSQEEAQRSSEAVNSNVVNEALQDALGATPETQSFPDNSGGPLTAGERDTLRVAVQRCWNVGSLSSAALATTVAVGFSMERDGRPDVGSIRLIGSEGGSDVAVRQAFEAARRAIIRCGASGFDLPEEKYELRQEIRMTFDPEDMSIK